MASELTLVIPTYNERANIAPLLAQVEAALVGVSWDAVFVDDSTDGTDEVLARLAATDRRIRLIHRDENRGGLAGAVVEGLAEVDGTYVCVLDADLQHPPECIPAMLGEARRTAADVVVASRYVRGGSAEGLAGPFRRFCSSGLKWLSRAAFPLRLARISDPLGGYFIVRRAILQGVALRPVGYKILLEILVRCQWQVAREVPYRFRPRRYGQTKATFRQGLLFLRHLGVLWWEGSPVTAPWHPQRWAARTRPAPEAPAPRAPASA
jgi:dolichol-phosphate mannosyltransferase